MKKILLCLLMLLLCVCSGCGKTDNLETENKQTKEVEQQEIEENIQIPEESSKTMDGVFRYSNWGDSMEDVIAAEGVSPTAKDDTGLLFENMNLLSYDVTVCYFFGDNGLDSASYSIVNTHTNDNLYLEDFESIDKALKEKYGEPFSEGEDCTNDIFQDDPGMALYMGSMQRNTYWQTENAGIIHSISSDNFEISHSISYFDLNREKAVDTEGL